MRDSDVRSAVRRRLDVLHAGDPNTRVVEEMGVWSGSVRIDIAVINGELCGFELKSDRDTLERLPTQADIYSRVFDRVHLVVGSKHSTKALSHIPEWWGVIVATQETDQVTLSDLRESSGNPGPNAYLIAQLLWKNEAVSVLETLGIAAGWRSRPVKLLHERLASEVPLEVLKLHVRETLKSRERPFRAAGP